MRPGNPTFRMLRSGAPVSLFMSADRPINATERGRNSMSIALRLTVSILVICLFRRSVRLAYIQRGDASFIPAKHATQHFTGMFGQQRRRAVGGSVGPLEHERAAEQGQCADDREIGRAHV